jgi:hypothetical protein
MEDSDIREGGLYPDASHRSVCACLCKLVYENEERTIRNELTKIDTIRNELTKMDMNKIQLHHYKQSNSTLNGRSNDSCYAIFTNGNDVYLAIRGTQNTSDWLTNVCLTPTADPDIDRDIGIGVEFHSGIWCRMKDMYLEAVKLLNEVVNDKPQCQVIVTGHSLGAALAQLFVVKWRGNGLHQSIKDTSVYTFALPQVYYYFSGHLGERSRNFFTYRTESDPVPLLPTLLGKNDFTETTLESIISKQVIGLFVGHVILICYQTSVVVA